MKILMAHSRYRQPGGEETVFQQEVALLQDAGHEVLVYDRSNWESAEYPLWRKTTVPLRVIWAEDTRRELRVLLRAARPDIAHFHNTHYMISPAAYYACRDAGVPVVQTIHNYRLLCANGWFFRSAHVCEDCVGRTPPWPAVLHGCYRGSRVQTAVMATMLSAHRLLGTWQKQVHRYIALTEFMRDKLVAANIPREKIAVKPNFIHPDPGPGSGAGGYALFVGRLSQEKGLDVLLKAWEELADKLPLKIVGHGPLAHEVQKKAGCLTAVEWAGQQPRDSVLALMREATVLVFPSICYEGFPMVLVEAFACGLPVIGAALGNTQSIIEVGRSGLLFDPGNAQDLAAKIGWLLDHPAELARMRYGARATFEERYTAEANYVQLMQVYREALAAE
ncbi:MAG: glycosyltransferase family 4 protein [Anaerolineales bacterium]|nr:glycosyltransferase family 4 protein [Anaerolineales bacterium]